MNQHPPLVFDNKKINENYPWQDDVLKRKKYADALTRIAESIATPLTVCVNGKWGTGKTFLLRRWQQTLMSQNRRVIYFNAWTDDYSSNPLVCIIGQLIRALPAGDKKIVAVLQKVKKAAAPFIKTAAEFAAPGSSQLINSAARAVSAFCSERILDKYAESTEYADTLKERLQELAEQTQSGNFPLVIVVDELDRCRPTFAVEVLETIKHFFGIPGIMFVLGVNGEDLQKSIRQVYGDIDAVDYLRRFYEFEITLSEPKSSAYWVLLMETHPMATASRGHPPKHRAKEFATRFFDAMGLTLRETEHCFRAFCLVLQGTNAPFDYKELVTFLIILKVKDPKLYRQFISGECLAKDVINYLHGLLGEGRDGDGGIEWAMYSCALTADRNGINAEFEKAQRSCRMSGKFDENTSHLAYSTMARCRQGDSRIFPNNRELSNHRNAMQSIAAALDCFGN